MIHKEKRKSVKNGEINAGSNKYWGWILKDKLESLLRKNVYLNLVSLRAYWAILLTTPPLMSINQTQPTIPGNVGYVDVKQDLE